MAGQWAGRLSGLQRGLTSMWLSRVNIAFLNVPFASALRARRGGFTSLQTKSVHFSDSLNIFPRARWVVCPLGRTRGHGRRFIYPRRVREKEEKKIPCSNGRLQRAWPLLVGQQREELGDLFIFSLALLAIKLCLAGIVKQGRITYSWFRD